MPLEAIDTSFSYTGKNPPVLHKVSLTVEDGQRVSLVAPSGFGKTTLVKILAGYEAPTGGKVLLDKKPLPRKGVSPVQLISQHPETAINPRWRMRKVLEESGPLDEKRLDALGIERAWLGRYPRELSGGELQRFCIARALGPATRFLIADEISTMLDVITQAQIWHYLLSQVRDRKIGLLVVTHNLDLAKQVSTRIIDLRHINQRSEPS